MSTRDNDSNIGWIADELKHLHEAGLYNHLRIIESPMDAWVQIDGRRLLNFCANNYLGLANHPRVREAAKNAIDRMGIGPGAVRSIAGTMTLHEELEESWPGSSGPTPAYVSERLHRQSGHHSGAGRAGDVIFSDELNHASIIDGCRLSRARSCAISITTWTTCAARSKR